MHPSDRAYQTILWRKTTEEPKEYQIVTVTYGTASAPSLATRNYGPFCQQYLIYTTCV